MTVRANGRSRFTTMTPRENPGIYNHENVEPPADMLRPNRLLNNNFERRHLLIDIWMFRAFLIMLGIIITYLLHFSLNCSSVRDIPQTLFRVDGVRNNIGVTETPRFMLNMSLLETKQFHLYQKLLMDLDDLKRENRFLQKKIQKIEDLEIQRDICHNNTNYTDEDLKQAINEVLFVQETDYALESLGAFIISTVNTVPYNDLQPWVTLFDIKLYQLISNPRTIIQMNTEPGSCFYFQGHSAQIQISLASAVYITSFTLEYVPSKLTLDRTSAPKDFSVIAITDDELIELGSFTFKLNDGAKQKFRIDSELTKFPYRQIELNIHTNYGSPHYTCIHRFQVHGKPFALP